MQRRPCTPACKHVRAGTSIQAFSGRVWAPLCRHLRAGSPIFTSLCGHLQADISGQATPYRHLRAGFANAGGPAGVGKSICTGGLAQEPQPRAMAWLPAWFAQALCTLIDFQQKSDCSSLHHAAILKKYGFVPSTAGRRIAASYTYILSEMSFFCRWCISGVHLHPQRCMLTQQSRLRFGRSFQVLFNV